VAPRGPFFRGTFPPCLPLSGGMIPCVKRSERRHAMPYVAKDFGSWSDGRVQRDAAQEPLHALPGVRGEYEQDVGPSRGMLAREDGHPEYAELKRASAGSGTGCACTSSTSRTSAARAPSIRPRSSGRRSPPNSQPEVEADFRPRARCADRLVVLYQDKAGGRLFNQWVNEHDVGNPAERFRSSSWTCSNTPSWSTMAEAGRLHRGVFPERELEGGRGPALLT